MKDLNMFSSYRSSALKGNNDLSSNKNPWGQLLFLLFDSDSLTPNLNLFILASVSYQWKSFSC